MAIIQHKNIADDQLHQIKGAAIAIAGQVPVATGAGTTTFRKIPSSSLEGLPSDGGSSNLRVAANGAGGFRFAADTAYGSLSFYNNSGYFPITAASDNSLMTDSQYVKLAGSGAPWVAEMTRELWAVNDSLSVTLPGSYKFEVTGVLNTDSSPDDGTVGVKIVINENNFLPGRVKVRYMTGESWVNIYGSWVASLNPGDTVSVYVAGSIPVKFDSCKLTGVMIGGPL